MDNRRKEAEELEFEVILNLLLRQQERERQERAEVEKLEDKKI